MPARDVLPPAGRWAPLADHWLTFMTSAPPPDISTLDCALYNDSPDNWAVLDGFGALVAAHGAAVPVPAPPGRLQPNNDSIGLPSPSRVT